MKYIKTYEESKSNLKIGDYVLLDLDQLKKYCIESEQDFKNYNLTDDKCKIISMGESDLIKIEFYDGPNPDMNFVLPNEIKRKLTPEEIIEFKQKETNYKYNI